MKTYLKAFALAFLVASVSITFAARNGSGTYTLPAGNPVNTGTAISSTWANNTLSDIATALSESIARDGQTVPTANLPMGGFIHTGVGNASARTHYASAAQVQDGSLQKFGSVGGTANAITANLTPAITSYTTPLMAVLYPTASNTGATTLAANGLSALDVQKYDGDELAADDLVTGVPAFLVLDSGADDWILINPGTADASAAAILSRLITVDGAGSGLDADTLDGVSSAGFWQPGNDGAGSGLDADTVDGQTSTIFAFRANNLSDLASAATARTNLNVPTRTGGDASGTWSINISGNAATATSATSASSASSATFATSAGSITGQGNLATTNANAAETRNISGKSGTAKTLSSSGPSGGSDGDIWYRW